MEENGKQSKIEHKPDEVMKKVGGGYLPYVECENCGHHITLKGWRALSSRTGGSTGHGNSIRKLMELKDKKSGP